MKIGWTLACVALVACSPKKNTEIVVSVRTDVPVPKDLDAIQIDVLRAGVTVSSEEHPVGPTSLHLPGTLGVVPGGDDATPVEIVVRGMFHGGTRVLRKVRTTFVKERALLLPVPLHFACFDTKECSGDETCVGGVCRAPDVESNALSNYDPDLVFPPAGATSGNGCWDPNVCLPSSVPLAPDAADPCAFTLPDTIDPARVTLSLRTSAASGVGFCDAGACRVPVDADAREGFTVTGRTAHLTEGLCARLKTGGVIDAVEATSWCGQKTPWLPFCDGPPYPPAPYGLNAGDTFPPFQFQGYKRATGDWTTIDVRELYEPKAATKKGVWLDVAATWCDPCKAAAPLFSGWRAKYEPDVHIIELITLTDGGGATRGTADAWISAYKMDVDVAIDPDQLTRPDHSTHYPFSYMIDARTMKVFSATLGTALSPSGNPIIDAFSSAP